MGFMNQDRGLDRMLQGAQQASASEPVQLTNEARQTPARPMECANHMHAAMTLLRNGGDRGTVKLPAKPQHCAIDQPTKMPTMQTWTDGAAQTVQVSDAMFQSVRAAKLSGKI